MANDPTYDISQYTDALEDAKDHFEAAVKGKDVRKYIASQCDATIDLANAINDNLNDAVEMSLAVPDTTLTQEGKPAEAKAAGDRINAKADNYDCTVYNSFSMDRANGAIGQYSFAINASRATGSNSIGINGADSTANGSIAAGYMAAASASGAVAVGEGVQAKSSKQLAVGQYNVADENGDYVYILGCGSNAANRKNAQTVDSSGNTWFAGSVYVGGADLAHGSELATKAYVDSAIATAIGNAIGGSY